MAYLSQIEAALLLGLKVETVEQLSKACPKLGETRTLKFVMSEAGKTYDEAELEAYRDYLNEPWPLTKSGKRPAIPKAIQDDVKEESHLGCAICGHMDNGEVVHIDSRSIGMPAMAETLRDPEVMNALVQDRTDRLGIEGAETEIRRTPRKRLLS